MTITALPTPPSRQDPANFPTRGDAFLAALPTFATEANALAADVNAKSANVDTKEASATSAAASAASDAASALSSKNSAAASATAAAASQAAAASSQTAAAASASAAATSETNAAAAASVGLPEIGTYATLRAYTGGLTAFLVRGVANIFDGGFGVFRVDSTDTTSTDNGGTILVGADGRRWKRDYVGPINVKWFGAKGDWNGTSGTDDFVAFQAALDAAPTGKTVFAPDAYYLVDGTLNITKDRVRLLLDHGAGIAYNSTANTTFTLLNITGNDCAVDGGLGRGFVGPSAWDGANATPTFAVFKITGNNCTISTRLYNIYKWGVWFKDCVGGTVDGSRIIGNYPSASFTGTQVGHAGVLFDPSSDDRGGSFILNGSHIESCVQGCLPANYGGGVVARGVNITGNVFYSCWNHGVYSNFTNGAVVTGNSFNRCQIPVVVSGDDNTVVGNSIYTATDVSGDQREIVGISVRDGSRNNVSNNTIKGVLTAGNPACIAVQDINGTSELNDNIISNNTIYITEGTGVPIRILGSTNAVNRNMVSNNTIVAPGAGAGVGAISIYGYASGYNAGNQVLNNNIKTTSAGEGVVLSSCVASAVKGNTHEAAFNAGAATNVYVSWFINSTKCEAAGNTALVRPGNGTNITFYGFRESGTSANNRVTELVNNVDSGSGATFSFAIINANSGLVINQTLTGAPAWHAKIGSMWRRTDGGASTTLYIKESGTDGAGWVGK